MTRLRADRSQELPGQLIRAQEAERARVARRLHDDVGQRLAALSLELSGLRRHLATRDRAELEATVTTLQQQTMGLADMVGQLAHELNGGAVRQLGLAGALKLECDEFQRAHGVEVRFLATEGPTPVAPDEALCLFRAAQEMLGNVARHASARSVQVALSHENGQRVLTVADDGTGFDPAHVRAAGEGLGLLIVEERARLLHGTVQIESGAAGGTTVRIAVPAAAR